MNTIFNRVAITKNVPIDQVETAWKFMIQRMLYALDCSNLVFVPGFGLFFIEHNCVFFSRIVHHTKKIKKATTDKHKLFIVNNVVNDLNQVVYNTFMMPVLPPALVNTIRIKHDVNDPLDIAVFIEINREVIVRKRDLFVHQIGWFYRLENPNVSWYQYMHCIKLKNQDTTKINIWIPKLVSIIKMKLEQNS